MKSCDHTLKLRNQQPFGLTVTLEPTLTPTPPTPPELPTFTLTLLSMILVDGVVLTVKLDLIFTCAFKQYQPLVLQRLYTGLLPTDTPASTIISLSLVEIWRSFTEVPKPKMATCASIL